MAETVMPSNVQQDKVVNNLTTTAAGYVLDARQGKALSDQMATKVSLVDLGILSANSSASYTVSKSARLILFTIGSGSSKSMFIIASTSSGSMSSLEVAKDSYISINTSTAYTVTLSNSGSQNPRVYCFAIDGTIATASS